MLIFKSIRPPDDSLAGLISVLNWTMAPDGRRYLYFWARRWQVITDAQIPVEHFHSSERWQMVAVSSNSDVLAVFPGCQVKAWFRCEAPATSECFVLEDT